MNYERPKYLDEVCANCGCTNGAHHASNYPYPYNYCPGTEGRMDWENGPGTVFEPLIFSYIERGAPLNDVLWYLNVPGVPVGTTISCSSAPTLAEAQREASIIVSELADAFKAKKGK